MARVTIEDSLKNVPNLFFLIKLAAKRAHQLQRGATPKIPVHQTEEGRVDAPTVFALREIAAGFTDFDNVVIPQKDMWGNDVPVREHKTTESTLDSADAEKNIYMVRNKVTGTIIGENMTLAEAEACKGRVAELIVELRKAKQNEE